MMQFFVFILLIFTAGVYSSDRGFSYYVIPYEISGKWFIDEYEIQPDKLQQRINQRIYNNESDWAKDYQKLKLNKRSQNAIDLVDTEEPRAVVWSTKENWSLDWEIKFQEWVRANVGPTFFKDNNLATDCADVMFTLRWIFARINYLSIGNTLAGSRKLFTNESFVSKWLNLKRDIQWQKDEVFLAALNYIMDNTYTGTLYEDSMPVKITSNTFAEGNFFLTMRGPQSMGHTEVVFNINKQPGMIRSMASDVPRKVRVLYSYASYPSYVDAYRFSLRSLKWITRNALGKWAFVSLEQHPHYSMEQFTPEFSEGFDRFYNALFYRIGIQYDYTKHYTNLRDRLITQVNDRVSIVNDGFQFCLTNNCDTGTSNYDLWSTPSRDQKIVDSFLKINEVLQKAKLPDLEEDFKKILNTSNFKLNEDETANLLEIKENFENRKFTSDPRDQVLVRWGF